MSDHNLFMQYWQVSANEIQRYIHLSHKACMGGDISYGSIYRNEARIKTANLAHMVFNKHPELRDGEE